MEPGDVTPVLLDSMLANRKVVVPHLHLPLQSGSDEVLQKMNRQYKTEQYLEMIAMVNERLTEDFVPPAITTDIICGFPTETEEDFNKTVEVATKVGYLHMHVFPYSVRSGTAAARWKQHAPNVVRSRVQTLLQLDNELSLKYRNTLQGKQVHVMLEQKDDETGFFKGRSQYYAEITLKSSAPVGELVLATVTEVSNNATLAKQDMAILNNT
jgi:threonylcarbamoyladenosine tRNA methylthiotransferase MtaB